MGDLASAIVGLLLLGLVVFGAISLIREALRRLKGRSVPEPEPVAAAPPPGDGALAEARRSASALEEELDYSAGTVAELLANETFVKAVEALAARNEETSFLVRLARDRDRWVSRIALAVLVDRRDLPPDWPSHAVRRLESSAYDHAGLLIRTLWHSPGEVVGPVLAHIDDVDTIDVAELISFRVTEGLETVDMDLFRRHVPLTLADDVAVLFEDYELPAPVREAFEEWRNTTTASLGPAAQYTTPWNRPYDDPPALVTARRREIVDAITEAVTSDPPRSVLLVGEHGVGKTALVRAALDQLPDTWSAFEATASSVNAGAMYIGQLEGRVEEIVTALRDKEIVWVFPAFHEALYAGTYSSNPTGLLDALAPHIESGAVRIVGETSPTAYERLIKERPSVASLVQAVRVRPLADEETTAVVRHALDTQATEIAVSDEVLTESLELAQQFIPGVAPPGNALQLLQAAVDDAVENGRSSLAGGDMLATLASLSGLPLAVLDPTRPLHLDDVRAFFEQRVLGQPEAIDCLVDRIALVKAGLTDPSRPLAVFLFVGPTGTGKTEIAKALAEFLFGSANRMVRLDMSEYQTSDSHERLLADANVDDGGAPLIASVRKDPFAVILLDEFEKAAQPIWDLFLQVFDDGRLTDKHGRTADFRRCVIILTSNVGSAIAGGSSGLGFERPDSVFRPEQVERALARHFRPEFLNRLDRVVVFRPFERSQMHALLDKELADVTQRRGWRGRPWAVELDESAIAFLIEQGFSPELGARPLKRAVERHLLSPLARTIVAGKVPEGEQFLFVTAPNGEIEVTFVDPDADDAATDDVIVAEAGDAEAPLSSELPEVRDLVVRPRTPGADQALRAAVSALVARVESDAVRGRKESALAAINRPGFWEDDQRFVAIAEAEYLDRLDTALRTALKLTGRLGQPGPGRGAELTKLLASRLFVLESAVAGLETDAPHEVFVRVRPSTGSGPDAVPFARRLVQMYVGWGERRGMRVVALTTSDDATVLAVSGLGSGVILAPESGMHVLESDGEGSSERPTERHAVAIQVVPRLPGPSTGRAGELQLADEAFAATDLPPAIVRRYQFDPTPLVRDTARGYRTGQVERVLAGDFDVY